MKEILKKLSLKLVGYYGNATLYCDYPELLPKDFDDIFYVHRIGFIEKLRDMKFYDQERFTLPGHPQYEIYKDRLEEKAHDTGYNNAIEDIIKLLEK